jgi:outer membrane murein-binding lipoprotein Lpp
MRSVVLSLLLLSTLALAGCQSKAEKVEKLLTQYNTEYPAYAKDCLDETSGSARMLTGEKLTAEQTAALDGKKKERDTRCKPEADRLREMQREILAAQQ